MFTDDEKKDALVRMFVSYCRKTLLNARTDVLRERSRRRKHETLFCDLRQDEIESLSGLQGIPDNEVIFLAAGKPIGVKDSTLSDALLTLTPDEQAIVLLSYFAGWSDRRIGEDMGFPRSTVQNRRIRALARLSEILTEGGESHVEEAD